MTVTGIGKVRLSETRCQKCKIKCAVVMRQPQAAEDPLIFAAVTTSQNTSWDHLSSLPPSSPPLTQRPLRHSPLFCVVPESSSYMSRASDIGYHCFHFVYRHKMIVVFMLYSRSIFLNSRDQTIAVSFSMLCSSQNIDREYCLLR